MNHCFDEKEVPERKDQYGRLVKRLIHETTCGATKGFSMGLVTYTATEFRGMDKHEDQETIYIISGRGVAEVGGPKIELKPGICFYVPKGVEHRVVKIGEEPLRAIFAHGYAG